MSNSFKKYLVFGIAIVVIPLLLIAVKRGISNNTLPRIYGEVVKKDNGENQYHTVSSFEVTNQNGEVITNQSLEDKLYMANFFFTSCPVICPKMTTQILEVQNATKQFKNDLAFVSFSIDPKRDSVEKLKWFANRFELDQSNWHFVRTDKETIYKMARNDYMITAIEGTAEKNDYIHSELVVLVDKEQQIRGYYDLSKKEQYNQALNDIENLINYYNKENI